MTTIRRRSLTPAVIPANDLAARGWSESAAACFASVLHTILQEVEQTEESPLRVQPVAAGRDAPAAGPLIVAGIVPPARLPR